MALPNVFTTEVSNEITSRINKLTPSTTAQWGKMNVAQMLAHCNVTYEMMYTEKHPPVTNFMMKLLLKYVVKGVVTNEKPYKASSGTAPAFIIKDERNFEAEKANLISYVTKTQELGENHFDGKASHSFGILNKTEWNNMLYKHLNHHLSQFGV